MNINTNDNINNNSNTNNTINNSNDNYNDNNMHNNNYIIHKHKKKIDIDNYKLIREDYKLITHKNIESIYKINIINQKFKDLLKLLKEHNYITEDDLIEINDNFYQEISYLFT